MTSADACDACGSVRQRKNPQRGEYLSLPPTSELVECRDCGLCYLDPRPDLATLGRMYAEDSHFAFENGPRGAARQHFYAKKISRLGRWIEPPGKLLGLSCLDGGHALRAAMDLGWSVTGVEWCPGMADYARTRLHVDVVES